MFALLRVRFAFLALALIVPLGGCGGTSSVPAATGGPTATLPAPEATMVRPQDDSAYQLEERDLDSLGDFPDASLAGTYDGTFVEKTEGTTLSGSLVITLKIAGKAVSGDFVRSSGGQSITVTYTGTGRHTKHVYKMRLVGVAGNGCKGTGPATIANRKYSGSFSAPACDGNAAATFTYKALKAAT